MSAQVLVTGFGFLTLFLNARALGVGALGVLIVLQAAGDLARVLASFQTWELVVRFGAAAWNQGDYSRLRQVYLYALMLDLAAAFVSALALAAVFLFGGWLFGLSNEASRWGALYAVSLLALGSGASVGILKLTDRFGLLSMITVGQSAALALNAAVLAALDAPFSAYVWSMTILTFVGGIFVIAIGWRRTQDLARSTADRVAERAEPLDRRAALRFAVAASLASTLEAAGRRGEVLLVSGILGPAAAGLFGVASRSSALVARIAEVGRVSAYPEVAKVAAADGQAAKQIVFRMTRMSLGMASGAFFLILIFGDDLLSIGFGEAYRAAHLNFIWLCAAASLYAATFALAPYVQIIYGAGRLLRLTAVSFGVYGVIAVSGPLIFGLAGAGLGSLAFQLTLACLLTFTAFAAPLSLKINASASGDMASPAQSLDKDAGR